MKLLFLKCEIYKLQAVHRGERIAQNCIACGHQGIINMQHRLITYIVKNPPGADAAGTPSKKYVYLEITDNH